MTAYETQTRLTRNFLEGARRKRISYTPRGLWEAWCSLDAAMRVYIGTLVGLVTSVSLVLLCETSSTNVYSLSLPLSFSLDPAGSMLLSASLECHLITKLAAEVSSGQSPVSWMSDTLLRTRIGSLRYSYSFSGQQW